MELRERLAGHPITDEEIQAIVKRKKKLRRAVAASLEVGDFVLVLAPKEFKGPRKNLPGVHTVVDTNIRADQYQLESSERWYHRAELFKVDNGIMDLDVDAYEKARKALRRARMRHEEEDESETTEGTASMSSGPPRQRASPPTSPESSAHLSPLQSEDYIEVRQPRARTPPSPSTVTEVSQEAPPPLPIRKLWPVIANNALPARIGLPVGDYNVEEGWFDIAWPHGKAAQRVRCGSEVLQRAPELSPFWRDKQTKRIRSVTVSVESVTKTTNTTYQVLYDLTTEFSTLFPENYPWEPFQKMARAYKKSALKWGDVAIPYPVLDLPDPIELVLRFKKRSTTQQGHIMIETDGLVLTAKDDARAGSGWERRHEEGPAHQKVYKRGQTDFQSGLGANHGEGQGGHPTGPAQE